MDRTAATLQKLRPLRPLFWWTVQFIEGGYRGRPRRVGYGAKGDIPFGQEPSETFGTFASIQLGIGD